MARLRVKRELNDLIMAVYRGRWVVFGVCTASVGLVVLHTLTATPLYQAEADILLKFGREYVYRPEVGEEQPRVTRDTRDLVNSEIQILSSRELARETVQRVGPRELYPGIDAPPRRFTIKWLRQKANEVLALVHPNLADIRPGTALERATLAFGANLEVSGVGKTDVVRVAYMHPRPEMAAQAVETSIEAFKEKRLQVFADPRAEFLAAQVAEYRRRLEAAEQELETFRQTHRLYDLEQQRELLLTQRQALDGDLKATESRIEETAKRLEALREQASNIDETVPLFAENQRDPVVDNAKSRLLDLRLRENQLRAKYLDSSKLVQDVREQIALVEDFLAKTRDEVSTRTQSGKNQVHQELMLDIVRAEAEHESLVAKRRAVQQQIARVNDDLAQLDPWQNELNQLVRDVANNQSNYKAYLAKLEDAKVSEELNRNKVVNVSVIEPATVPLRPATPQKTLNLAFGIVFGLAAGLGLVFVRDQLRPRLLTVDNAEQATGLPVLARLPDRRAT